MAAYIPAQSVAHPAIRILSPDEEDQARWQAIQEQAEWRGKRLADIRRASGLTVEQLADSRIPGRPDCAHYTADELRNLEAGTTEITMRGGVQAAYAGMEQEYRLLIAAVNRGRMGKNA